MSLEDEVKRKALRVSALRNGLQQALASEFAEYSDDELLDMLTELCELRQPSRLTDRLLFICAGATIDREWWRRVDVAITEGQLNPTDTADWWKGPQSDG